MVDSCGEQLRPFLPTVIPALLRATQDLESVKLSYLSTRLGGTQSQELLDEARASMVKSYVTIETITKVWPKSKLCSFDYLYYVISVYELH